MKDSPILLFNIKVNLLLRVFLSYLNFSIISGVLIEKFFISFKEVGSFDFLNIFKTLSTSAFEQNPDIFENLKAIHIPIATASPCIIFPSKFPNDSMGELSKRLGKLWKDLKDKDKKKYEKLALKDKERYQMEIKKYKSGGQNINNDELSYEDSSISPDNSSAINDSSTNESS